MWISIALRDQDCDSRSDVEEGGLELFLLNFGLLKQCSEYQVICQVLAMKARSQMFLRSRLSIIRESLWRGFYAEYELDEIR